MESIVRTNLMSEKGYTPYCGNYNCHNGPRTKFNGEQFVCPDCGWTSTFPRDFIDSYKQKWASPLPSNDEDELWKQAIDIIDTASSGSYGYATAINVLKNQFHITKKQ